MKQEAQIEVAQSKAVKGFWSAYRKCDNSMVGYGSHPELAVESLHMKELGEHYDSARGVSMSHHIERAVND